MPHRLDGCNAKVARAKELIQALEHEIYSTLNSGAYRIEGAHEFERKRYVFRLHGPQLPLKISVLAGEIVHHLRSTLDHLVWAAARKDGLSDSKIKRLTFPVCTTAEKFEEAKRNGALNGVPENLQEFVESLQPFKSNDSKNSILQILHDLDIIEKHRLLVVVTHAARMGQNIKILGELTSAVSLVLADKPPHPIPFFRAIEDGVEVHWLAYETSTQPLWSIENDFSILVMFEKIGSHERVEALPILWQMYKLVENIFSIIEVRSN